MSIWLFYFIILLSTVLLALWSLLNRSSWLSVVLASVIVIFTRILQTTAPIRYEWHDGIFYFTIVEAILKSGRLSDPVLISWFPGAEKMFNFSAMHLTTAAIAHVIGINNTTLIRATVPSLYAVITLILLIGLATYIVGTQYRVLTGYTIVQLETFIHYQTQYHAQGFGLTLFLIVILILLGLLNRNNKHSSLLIVFVVVVSALAISHRFTTIAGVLIVFITVIGFAVYNRIPGADIKWRKVRPLAIFSTILAVIVAFAHIRLETAVVTQAITNSILVLKSAGFGFHTAPDSVGGSGGGNIIVNSFSQIIKAILIISAIPTFIYSFKDRTNDSTRFIVALLSASGIIAMIVGPINVEVLIRVILIGYIPLTLLAFKTMVDASPPIVSKSLIFLLTISIVMMGVIGGTVPSRVDPNSNIRADGYHEITPMPKNQYAASGYWVRSYNVSKAVGVTTTTRMAARYYGHTSGIETEYISLSKGRKYYIIDTHRRDLPTDIQIYSNGRVLVGYNYSHSINNR